MTSRKDKSPGSSKSTGVPPGTPYWEEDERQLAQMLERRAAERESPTPSSTPTS